jgi:hypothetical protein
METSVVQNLSASTKMILLVFPETALMMSRTQAEFPPVYECLLIEENLALKKMLLLLH